MSDVARLQIDPRELTIAEQANQIAELSKLVAEITQENQQLREENKQLKERIERLEALLATKLDAKSSKSRSSRKITVSHATNCSTPINLETKTPIKSREKNPLVESHAKPKNISSVIRLPSFRKALIATSAFTIGSSLRGELSMAKPSTCDTIFAISPVRPACHCRWEFATVAASSEWKSFSS